MTYRNRSDRTESCAFVRKHWQKGYHDKSSVVEVNVACVSCAAAAAGNGVQGAVGAAGAAGAAASGAAGAGVLADVLVIIQ